MAYCKEICEIIEEGHFRVIFGDIAWLMGGDFILNKKFRRNIENFNASTFQRVRMELLQHQ